MITIYALFLAIFLSVATPVNAQYDTNAEVTAELENLLNSGSLQSRYYYYPNLQAYYDRQTSTYIYTRNGYDWLESESLPDGLRGYSSQNGVKVALTGYDGETPYIMIEEHSKKYPASYSTKQESRKKYDQNQQR